MRSLLRVMLYATLGNVRLAKLLILLSIGGARRNRTDDLFNAIVSFKIN